MRDSQYRMMGHFVEANPKANLLGGQAPILGERSDVGGHQEDPVVIPGNRQVVGAEAASGQSPDKRSGGHLGHQRGKGRHHLAEPCC